METCRQAALCACAVSLAYGMLTQLLPTERFAKQLRLIMVLLLLIALIQPFLKQDFSLFFSSKFPAFIGHPKLIFFFPVQPAFSVILPLQHVEYTILIYPFLSGKFFVALIRIEFFECLSEIFILITSHCLIINMIAVFVKFFRHLIQ